MIYILHLLQWLLKFSGDWGIITADKHAYSQCLYLSLVKHRLWCDYANIVCC